jgi:hypothetical protein
VAAGPAGRFDQSIVDVEIGEHVDRYTL